MENLPKAPYPPKAPHGTENPPKAPNGTATKAPYVTESPLKSPPNGRNFAIVGGVIAFLVIAGVVGAHSSNSSAQGGGSSLTAGNCPPASTINSVFGYSIGANTPAPTTIEPSLASTGCDYGDGSENSPYVSVSWGGAGGGTWSSVPDTSLSGAETDTDQSGNPMLQFNGNKDVILIMSTGSLQQELTLGQMLQQAGY